ELRCCDVRIENGRIAEIGADLQSESQVDATGSFVLPGLIDLHTHGIGFESPAVSALKEYAGLEAARGTTTFYPTLFGPPETLAGLMERHRGETDELRQLPQIAGFRLESPYLAHTGAGVSKDLAPIRPETTDRLLKAGGGHINPWDISPELPGAPDLIRQLTSDGVVCSLSHTQATIEQARIAVDAGATLITHLFCTFVLPEVTDQGVYPQGLVDYLLIEDRVTCEIVPDGSHVPPLHVEKAFRCKSPEKITFITDSNFGAGLPPGEYMLPEERGKVLIRGSNDGVRLVDRGMTLSGSALTPIDGFRNAMRLFGKDMAAASQVCSRTPACVMGLNKGEIAVGRDADFVILNSDLEVLYTIVGGEMVYRKG
ncbi:MAG: amidohydrolase family protein, partial [Candidatus Latescibacteria bacterium]|nr:amidohydrolase family protein [Candidatus Latescibacterota bacterium]